MTDSDTTTVEATATSTDPANLITISLKNGAGDVQVDPAKLPDDVYREALMQGLKVIAERGMSKITKANIPDESQRRDEIKTKALSNIEDMYAGKIKITGAKKVKTSGAVMTEAMRLARNLVKDAMKAAKIKISTVKASEITAAAKAAIENDPSIVTTAEANLKAREATPLKIDISKMVKADPELVAKDEAKKAAKAAEKASAPLSAKQAGKVAPRAKGAKGESRPQA